MSRTSLNGKYDYDLIVIGGGSGGLAASKEAANLQPNARVACFDFVKPSPAGTTWGLGGTCVNVGCIPKKLMHYCSLLGHTFLDAKEMGWQLPELGTVKHDWPTLVNNVNDHIRLLNFNYKKALSEARVEYINALATFVDANTVEYTLVDRKTKESTVKRITSERFIIAVGGRPRYPTHPGAELGISSDDIFWRQQAPGKTLVVGASYIALECAGFLHHLGYDVSVMVRSILLRGFDQQVSSQIGEIMERDGIRFISPSTIVRMDKNANNKIDVTYSTDAGDGVEAKQSVEEFDTVLYAIGRDAVLADLNLDRVGVKVEGGKIVTNDADQTNIPHVYCIGDCAKDRPELTPVAIQAGILLARRLFASSESTKTPASASQFSSAQDGSSGVARSASTKLMDYTNVATTVFTPLEYGCVGLSQDAAEKKFGPSVICYASRFGVLEGSTVFHETIPKLRSSVFTGKNLWARQYALAHGNEFVDPEPGSFEDEELARKFLKQPCLAKLVCVRDPNNPEPGQERVVGFHYLGPNAGEITQGFALAVRLGARKVDFDDLVGIHPTAAEEFTTLSVVVDGSDVMKKGGC